MGLPDLPAGEWRSVGQTQRRSVNSDYRFVDRRRKLAGAGATLAGSIRSAGLQRVLGFTRRRVLAVARRRITAELLAAEPVMMRLHAGRRRHGVWVHPCSGPRPRRRHCRGAKPGTPNCNPRATSRRRRGSGASGSPRCETCSARAAIADAGPPRSPHACPYLTQAPTDMMRLVQNGTGRWRSKRSTNAACSRAGPNK